MPASIAAWRTVVPLGTVRERPSMVSVTVSITLESYQASRRGETEGGVRYDARSSQEADREAGLRPGTLSATDAERYTNGDPEAVDVLALEDLTRILRHEAQVIHPEP